jgi:hypothetical protein
MLFRGNRRSLLNPFLVSSFDSISSKPGFDIRKGITHPSTRFMVRDSGSIKSMPAQCFNAQVHELCGFVFIQVPQLC